MPSTINRKQIEENEITISMAEIHLKLKKRLQTYGNGTFASKHEILGIIAEEYHELVEAVKNEDLNNVKEELLDIAVGCLFGIACINAKGVEW